MSLDDLPIDVLEHVILYMDSIDKASSSLTSKYMQLIMADFVCHKMYKLFFIFDHLNPNKRSFHITFWSARRLCLFDVIHTYKKVKLLYGIDDMLSSPKNILKQGQIPAIIQREFEKVRYVEIVARNNRSIRELRDKLISSFGNTTPVWLFS
jgi:hypothetical protein